MLTVLCPTFNEENYIENVLRFFVESLPSDKELFIIDGGSTDGTIEIVKQWEKKNATIHLLHNPHKYVPQALNIGLRASTGKLIVRLDAHTVYSKNYFEKIIETFDKTGADIVGGPMNAVGENAIQKAVAYATSGWFGIGNSKFHDVNFSGFTDSVYLGAWKREIFNEVGFFDEQMMRNQDDEFHYRCKSKGKKIYLNAEIKSQYFPRSTYKSLFKQYFQYGLYKPLVIKKIKSEVKLRHLVPLFFVLYLLSFPIVFVAISWLLPLVLYFFLDVFNSFNSKESLNVKVASLLVYPILHISYGTGFLLGFGKKNKTVTS